MKIVLTPKEAIIYSDHWIEVQRIPTCYVRYYEADGDDVQGSRDSWASIDAIVACYVAGELPFWKRLGRFLRTPRRRDDT